MAGVQAQKALATIGTGPMKPVLDLALATFRPYAELHGYDLIIGKGDSSGRGPSWAKVVLLRRLLGSYDEVLWLDSDVLILDPSTDIAGCVPKESFQGLVEQVVSDDERAINAGVWFVRSCDLAKKFLAAVWDNQAEGEPGMWENLQMLDLLGYSTVRPYQPLRSTPWREGTALIGGEWNAMSDSENGRFKHYSAMSNQERRFLMWLDLHANYAALRPFRKRARALTRRLYSDDYFSRRIAGENAP